MIRALIRNPDTGQRRWFAFPLCFGKLIEIGFSGDFNLTARNSPTSKVAGCKGFGLVQGLAPCA